MKKEEILKGLKLEQPFLADGINEFLKEKKFEIRRYSSMESMKMARLLCADFYTYISRVSSDNEMFTFIATFEQDITDEQHFNEQLQLLLQNLHIIDNLHFKWDTTPASELTSSGYCFSLAGRLFYVLSMHPQSSRKSRRFHKPMVMFLPVDGILGRSYTDMAEAV